MKILALDSSATAASVAIVEDDAIIGQFFINTKLTHSQTLMPMVQSLLDCTCIKIEEIDLFAVCVGPGSFTGIRIGVSAIKGMAMALNKPCVAVSTLDAMSYNFIGNNCIVCAVMDARCNQVYNANYDINEEKINKLDKDSAVSIDELYKKLKTFNKKIMLVGDGANLCYNRFSQKSSNICLAAEHLRYQNAVGVANAGLKLYNEGKTISAAELMPVYLRLPQAERELKKRLETTKEN